MAKGRFAKRTQGLEERWQYPNALLLLIGKIYRLSIREKLQVELTVSSLHSPTSVMKFTFLFTCGFFFIFHGTVAAFTIDGFLNISTIFLSFENCIDITKTDKKQCTNSISTDNIISELYLDLFSYKIQ